MERQASWPKVWASPTTSSEAGEDELECEQHGVINPNEPAKDASPTEQCMQAYEQEAAKTA
eukprot:11790127-Prorocentrum_lima.AAC.1